MSYHESPSYWVWNNVLSLQDIKSLNAHIQENYDSVEAAEYGAFDKVGNPKKFASSKVIKWYKLKPMLRHIVDVVYQTNSDYCGYNLFPMTGDKELILASYSSKLGGKYDWHIDSGASPVFDTKLTVILNLSEKKYEGGQFQYISQGNEIVTIDRFNAFGSLIMFKSHLNHRVLPITKGERNSLTLFLNGPKFV